jgi:hypothetical protein
MLISTLVLAGAAAVLASPGYIQADLKRESLPQIVKRQSNSDLVQQVIPAEGGAVSAQPGPVPT